MWELLGEGLRRRGAEGAPIRFAVLGAGYLAKGLAVQAGQISGLSLGAVLARDASRAAGELGRLLCGSVLRVCKTEHEVRLACQEGAVALVENAELLGAAAVEVVVDCTGDPCLGARMALQSLELGQHFVASPETDATVGPLLARQARMKGLVYGGAYGDEPALIKEIYDYVSLLGFEVVAAGKFKNYHDVSANPDSVLPWAKRYNQNPRMLASFADGSKMALEMALVSNATGLTPDCRGMHCPQGALADVAALLSPLSDGGLLRSSGVVEVVRGVEPSGGVFAVVRTENPHTMSDMRYLKMGDGPNYLFYRPYHLAALEMPVSIAQAALLGRSSITAVGEPVSGVLTVAKRDLSAGTRLDGIGGYCCYGLIDHFTILAEQRMLPLGLVPGALLGRDVKRGEPLTLSDVELPRSDLAALYDGLLQQYAKGWCGHETG